MMTGAQEYKKATATYGDDGPFNDPVVRCYGCNKILRMDRIRDRGICPYCGMRRVRKLHAFNEEEFEQMQKWGIDPLFFKLFEGSEE